MQKRTVVSLILTLILALSIFSIVTCLGFSFGLGSKDKFQSTLLASNYYRELGKELEQKTTELLKSYGFPKELGKDLWLQTEIYRDMNSYTKNVLSGKEADTSFINDLKDKLTGRLDTYFEQNKPCSEETFNQAKQEVSTIFVSDYENSIRLPLLTKYPEFGKEIIKLSAWVYVIGGIITIGICILLFCMYRHKFRSLRYVTYGVFAGSLISLCATYLMKMGMSIDAQMIQDQAYQVLCNDILNSTFEVATLGGMVGILTGIVLYVVCWWMRDKNY